MKQFGFAVIGVDHWYSCFPMLESIIKNPHTNLVWLTDENQAHTKEIAAKFSPKKFGLNYHKALVDPDVDVVACYSSSDKNARICQDAAKAGKHILCIKPMAMNLDEADQIVKSVQQAEVKFFPLAASHLFSATFQTFQRWVNNGKIGQLISANCFFNASLPRDWTTSNDPGWFADPTRVPGGAWIDHAIYYIQVLRSIFGSEIISVEGDIANLKFPNLPVEDYGNAILTFENGKKVSIQANWLGTTGANRSGMSFFGTEGNLVWDTLLDRIAINGHFEEELKGWILVDEPDQIPSRSTKIIQHMLSCIREDRQTIATVEDAQKNLRIALAFYRAAKQHQTLELI